MRQSAAKVKITLRITVTIKKISNPQKRERITVNWKNKEKVKWLWCMQSTLSGLKGLRIVCFLKGYWPLGCKNFWIFACPTSEQTNSGSGREQFHSWCQRVSGMGNNFISFLQEPWIVLKGDVCQCSAALNALKAIALVSWLSQTSR